MDILTIVLIAVALVFALLAFITYRANSRSAEALVKMSADKSTAESQLQVARDKLKETEKNEIDVHRFQVENVKLQENLSSVEERHIQVTAELNSVREKRDELQDGVQELTASVSRLDAELKSNTEALQKESSEKDALSVKYDDLQQQHQKLTKERTQLDEKVKSVEEQLTERNGLEKRFSDAFKALSSDVLKAQGESFKSNAEESLKAREEAVAKLVKPYRRGLRSWTGRGWIVPVPYASKSQHLLKPVEIWHLKQANCHLH